MIKSIEIDEQIFQDLVKFYCTIYKMPPLSAKVYSYLIFDFDREGIPFEEFVEVFSASKSSVSTSINYLLSLNFIVDINKIDERKRYFTITKDHMQIRFGEIIKKMETEIQILDHLNNFRKKHKGSFSTKIHIYKELLHKNIENIKESINKLDNEK